jgi:hypothetical protein
MEQLAEILESELEEAVEVRSKKSLHNFLSILVNNILERGEINRRFLQIETEIKVLSETVKIGFENVNKRFEDMNKRFEDMNNRFEDMNNRFSDTNKKINILIWVISLWMTLLTALSVFLKLYQ